MTKRISEVDAREILLSAGFTPTEIYPGNAHIPWLCECNLCGEVSSKRVSIVKQGKGGCSNCSRFARVKPDLAIIVMRNNGFEPLEPYSKSSAPWKSECIQCKKISTPTYTNVKGGKSKCKYCSGRYKITEEEALLVFKEAGFLVLGKYKDAQSPILCRCNVCGLTSSPRLTTVKAGRRCKFCNYGGKDSFSQEVADKAFLEKGMRPLEPYVDSSTPRKCECITCGAACSPRLSNLRRWGGCRECATEKNAKARRFDEKFAVQQMVNAKLKPLETYVHSHAKWLCECLVCGELVAPTLRNIMTGGGCRRCAWNENGAKKRNDEDDARETFVLAGLNPVEPYRSRHSAWKSICLSCGKSVSPTLATVVRGSGCKYCAAPEMGSILYLIMHEQLHSYKIGRGNDSRVAEHKRHNWQVIATWDLETPSNAIAVERKVLYFVRVELGIPQFLDRHQMKSTGATETFSLDAIDQADLKRLVSSYVKIYKETALEGRAEETNF